MPFDEKRYMKEYHRKYYQEHKEELDERHKIYYKDNLGKIKKRLLQYRKINRVELLARAKALYEEKKQYVDNYKLSKGCSICGYNKCATALDFHHNGDKLFNISRRISGNTTLEKIKEEMDKCIVLCRNCHAELHKKESNYASSI